MGLDTVQGAEGRLRGLARAAMPTGAPKEEAAGALRAGCLIDGGACNPTAVSGLEGLF
jgi:alkylhydroperoxidase/carboxymuconolactone decarboxylase family protein YurZ